MRFGKLWDVLRKDYIDEWFIDLFFGLLVFEIVCMNIGEFILLFSGVSVMIIFGCFFILR